MPGWLEYLEMRKAGVQPWAPIGDRAAEDAAIAKAHELTGDDATTAAGRFAAHA